MRKLLVVVMLLPALALAQGRGPGTGPGPGAGPRDGRGRGDPEQAEKRMRLARVLGLAEALDLDAAAALKMGETMARFDDRRLAAHKQARDARQVLRDAARTGKAAPAEVDQALQKIFDARATMLAADRELVAAVTKDLPPEKRARAALFLSRFEERIERRMFRAYGPGRGPGPGAEGRMGPGGRGQALGFRGGGPGPCYDDGECPGFAGDLDDE